VNHMTKKRWFHLLAVVAVLGVIGVGAAGCGSGGAGQKAYEIEVRLQGADTQQLDKNQPPPSFSRSEIREELIDIREAQARGVQSTSFFMPEGNSKTMDPQGSCPSIGAPVPDTDQITNPSQVIKDNKKPIENGGGNLVIDQQDPDGVYRGPTSGTWVMCIDTNTGKTYAQYWEGPVRVVMAASEWDFTKHEPVLTGEPPNIFTDVKINGGSTIKHGGSQK